MPDFGIISTASGRYLRLGAGQALGMAASPDGTEVAVEDSSHDLVSVYDVATGRLVASTAAKAPLVKSWGDGSIFFDKGFLLTSDSLWS